MRLPFLFSFYKKSLITWSVTVNTLAMAKQIILFIFLSLFVACGLSLHRFEMDLIKKLNAENADKHNFVISPFAIHQALAMLYLEKDTHRDYQLAKVLRITGKGTEQIMSYFSERYTKAISQEFIMTNQIFYKHNFIIPNHIMSVSAGIHVDVAKIPFTNSRRAGGEITKYLSKSINDFDPEMWRQNPPTNKTRLVAIQGLLVEPKWKFPFDWFMWKNFTSYKRGMKPTFFNTKMMYGTGPFASFLEGNVRGVTIPFSKSNIELIIFMSTVRNNNNHEILGDLKRYLKLKMRKNDKAHLYIPVCMVNNTLDLGKTLESFGLKKIFAGKKAAKGSPPASIFKQFSALTVKPREYQWEAEYPDDDDNKVIIIDKPFVFVIKDSKTIYMAGRVDTMKRIRWATY